MRRIAVLMYHGVGEPADPSEGVRYTVTVEELLEQMADLDPARVLTPAELVTGAGRTDHGVVLTFDDGDASVLDLAAPVLARRKLPAILFMTTAFIGKALYLGAAGLRELAGLGFAIGAHGATHRFLNTLSDRELDEELVGAKKTLEDVLGKRVSDLSLPGGRGGPRVTERAKAAGYDAIYTSVPGWNGAGMNRTAIRRTAIRRGMPRELVRRYAECDPVAHARDVATMASRGLVRRAVGEDRYHRLTARVLSVLRRQ